MIDGPGLMPQEPGTIDQRFHLVDGWVVNEYIRKSKNEKNTIPNNSFLLNMN